MLTIFQCDKCQTSFTSPQGVYDPVHGRYFCSQKCRDSWTGWEMYGGRDGRGQQFENGAAERHPPNDAAAVQAA